jgi:hypothetical protein
MANTTAGAIMTERGSPPGPAPHPSAEGIAAAAGKATAKGPPPVHLWDPPFCGDLDIRIARDGSWHYLGTPIGREGLVRLFASILKLEGGRHYLVTPVEKVGITVEDAPFVAVDCAAEGDGTAQVVRFTTNVGDEVAAGPGAGLRAVRGADGAIVPYVEIRRGLEARVDRKTFYRLVSLCDHAPHAGGMWFGLWSGGVFFPLVPSAEAADPA